MISTLAKIFNKILIEKLRKELDERNILPEYSFGFRKGKGTNDYITALIEEVQHATTHDKYCLAIVTDIEKAFDNVDTNTLIEIMQQKN